MTPPPTSSAAHPATTAEDVARSLLAAGCIEVHTDEPFRLPSGWASPVYMECRRLISFPDLRRQLVRYALELLRERHCLDGIASIAGAEASGIALAAWIADALELLADHRYLFADRIETGGRPTVCYLRKPAKKTTGYQPIPGEL